jgi:adenine-specific DNA-methyltransferase
MTDLAGEHFRRCCIATPPELADAMVQVLGDGPGFRWLEPCVGQGAILEALQRAGIARARIRGLDLNHVAGPADHLADVNRGTEFLTWALATTERFDRVVANPPYLSLARAPKAARDRALELRFRRIAFDRRTNCWAAFLVASVKLLREGGSLAFLLPAAWDYAAYAEKLRRGIFRWFASVRVVRSREPMCDNVIDANVVLVATGYKQAKTGVQRVEVSDLREAVTALTSSRPAQTSRLFSRSRAARGTELGEILKVRIGVVTGDASVFLLTEEDRLKHRIPEAALRCVVTRAHQIRKPWLTRPGWDILRSCGERVWLFAPESDDLRDEDVAAYIKQSSTVVKKAGYKIARRESWYHLPAMPKAADVFISGMSKLGPVMCLNRMRGLSATNTLYVGQFVGNVNLEERAGWALSFLSSTARRALSRVARRYPDGLLKIEPGDLMRIRIPPPFPGDGTLRVYERAVRVFITQGSVEASKIADAWLRGRDDGRR